MIISNQGALLTRPAVMVFKIAAVFLWIGLMALLVVPKGRFLLLREFTLLQLKQLTIYTRSVDGFLGEHGRPSPAQKQ